MMHGHEKSDLVIVVMKPANKAKEPTVEASAGANAAESVERRAGAKGNAHQQSTQWTQSQDRVSQALERIRQAFAVTHPRWEPYAGKPHVRMCVQERLACSAGDRPAGAKVRRPVVRIAGWRETKTLKPIDEVSLGEIYESSGRNGSERRSGLESD